MLNYTSLPTPLSPAAIGTNTVGRKGKTRTLQNASTDITLPYNTSLSYPQHCASPYPHVRDATLLSHAHLQPGEEPRLLRTVNNWPSPERPKRISKRRDAETPWPMGYLVLEYISTIPIPPHGLYKSDRPESYEQETQIPPIQNRRDPLPHFTAQAAGAESRHPPKIHNNTRGTQPPTRQHQNTRQAGA